MCNPIKAVTDPFGLYDGDDEAKKSKKQAKKAAAAAEAAAAKRQADITQGQANIDSAFGSFNDDFYNNYTNDYTGYYFPELDNQYKSAQDQLTAALAGKGMLTSSYGASNTGKLLDQYNQQKTQIANQAQDAANALRGQVQDQKSSLYALNQSSADPAAINAQALADATTIQAPQSYSPLGQVFSSVLGNYANYNNAKNNSPGAAYQSSLGAVPTAGAGSGRVIN